MFVSSRLMIYANLMNKAISTDGLIGFAAEVVNAPFQRGFFWAFRSFWAFLGWETLPVGDGWVWLLMGLCGVAAVGWLRLAMRQLRCDSESNNDTVRWRAWLVFLLATATIVLLMALQSTIAGAELFIGRYLFAAILPIVALLVIGWREVVPPRWRTEGLALIMSLFVVVDAAVLLDYAIPFFYPLWR
jgi:hypothetical protein